MSRDKWQILPIPEDPEAQKLAIRLNALGSLYFFAKFVLQRHRLVDHLHGKLARSLERENLHLLLEVPRDHFKTTLASECYPIWRALPFNERDEVAMRELGYDDAWVRWMQHAHKQDTSMLLVSESITNASKIGARIDAHYYNNSLFRELFKEIIPDEKCVWNSESKHQKSSVFRPHGEGTFDFLGRGGAVQSRHYPLILQDDPIGFEAASSQAVMDSAIEYHQLLAGVLDGPGEELYIGNPWGPMDVGAWIREHQPEWDTEMHSAEGGCCPDHPPGVPIFPQEFTVERLKQIRERLGPYLYSHQFLCQRVRPEECVFKPDWLRFYHPTPNPLNKDRHLLRHSVADGETIPDLDPNYLMRSMVVDPNHAGEQGRCNHAIVVTGLDPETDRVYLLDVWAETVSYDALLAEVYRLGTLWNLQEFWLETVAAQKYLKYHIDYRNKVESRRLVCRGDLKSEKSVNAKRTRIEALEPLLRQGKVWVRKDQTAFLNEYYVYPAKRSFDVLDALSYTPQTWNAIHAKRIRQMLDERKNRHLQRSRTTGY